MKYSLVELWALACKHDNIDPKSKFVVFSDNNPWMKKYNFAMRCIFATR